MIHESLPHFVTPLGFKDFENLFSLSFGRISHDCAGIILVVLSSGRGRRMESESGIARGRYQVG